MTPDLFRPAADAEPVALAALAAGAVLSVSVSGGKDSQALTRRVLGLRRELGWPGPVELVHADLGRAEWAETPAHVEAMAAEASEIAGHPVPLVVVRRAKGDLVQRIEERLESVASDGSGRVAKPFWPSPAQRYCTSDLKRGPIRKHARTHGAAALVVSAQGMRAGESPFRRKMPRVSVERGLSGKAYAGAGRADAMTAADALAAHLAEPQGRLVLTWLAIHDWTEDGAWDPAGPLPERAGRLAEAAAARDVTVLLRGGAVLPGGGSAYGSPYTPAFMDWHFMYPRAGPEAEAEWAAVPEGLDLLVTHGPPHGVRDRTDDGALVGCAGLARRLLDMDAPPRAHVFGHVHEAGGLTRVHHPGGETAHVNASVLDGRYRVVRGPVVLDL